MRKRCACKASSMRPSRSYAKHSAWILALPGHIAIWVLCSKVERNAADATTEFREATRLDPDLIDAHNNLAIMLAGQRRLPDAVMIREMIRIDPDSATAYYNLASVLADMDQDVESAAALREVIRINPDHYNAHQRGELFRLEGKYDESAKQFREFLRLAPGDTPASRQNMSERKVSFRSSRIPSSSPHILRRMLRTRRRARHGRGSVLVWRECTALNGCLRWDCQRPSLYRSSPVKTCMKCR